MTIKALATIPTAVAVGIGGQLGYRAFERWADLHAIRFTRLISLVVYAGFFIAPFLFCVIGLDRKRWKPDYNWFSQEAKTDQRQMWIRWAAYFLASLVAYAL